MNKFNNLRLRFFGTPLLLEPSKAETILNILSEKFSGEQMAVIPMTAQPQESYSLNDGVATIEMRGTLVRTGSWVSALSKLASYSATKAMIADAIADDEVEQIALIVDSGGGEATGVADLSDLIREARTQKPIHCFVDGACCSACYWIASSCTSITISQDSRIGSIGAVMALKQLTEAADKQGIKVHLFFAGSAKVDGHPFSDFSDESKERLQNSIDSIYSLFVKSVALDGRLNEEAVRATEARVYMGQDAVNIGLADSVGKLDNFLISLKEGNMPKEKATETVKAEDNTITQAMLDDSVAEATAKATADGITAERARLADIDTMTIKGLEDVAAEAKAQGWDQLTFLKAQTEAQQKIVTETATDPKLNHINELRNEAGEEDAIKAVAAKTPEKAPEEITELAKSATDEEIRAAFEGSDYIKAEFNTVENFTALVKFSGYEKEVN